MHDYSSPYPKARQRASLAVVYVFIAPFVRVLLMAQRVCI